MAPKKGKGQQEEEEEERSQKDNKSMKSQKTHNEQGGGGGGGKGQCAECGVERDDFNHCVHCAQKVCDNCRMKHIEALLEDFMGSREEAATTERQIYKNSVTAMNDALNGLKISRNVGERMIHNAFKEIEKALNARKAELIKELHIRCEEEEKPLLKEKRQIERELYFASDKFRDACKVSITPVRGAVASSFNKMPDGEFAQVCVSNSKAKESSSEFATIQDKMDKIAAPQQVRFKDDDDRDNLLDFIAQYAVIEVSDPNEDKKSKKGNQSSRSSRGGGRSQERDEDDRSQGKGKKGRGDSPGKGKGKGRGDSPGRGKGKGRDDSPGRGKGKGRDDSPGRGKGKGKGRDDSPGNQGKGQKKK